MNLAYFDCFSGISGDMTLGAMVDLGVPMDWLKRQLANLPIHEYSINSKKIERHGIQATRVGVEIQESHHHRTYTTIQELIHNSPITDTVKSRSLAIFDRIATAEAAIHGVPKEEVHFHEVGSVDAIVDIVGACLCLEYLEIEDVIASPLPLGGGFVRCQHGTLPVPAPATLEILKGVPVFSGPVENELVTPTGAAIIAEIASSFAGLPAIRVDAVGYGAGTREFERQPNLLRVVLGRSEAQTSHMRYEKLVMVECNIDDMNPEWFGYLMDRLFADGALDVFWVPVHMKKNRPGTMVQVLCHSDLRDQVVERMLLETTTLGVRYYDVCRNFLNRKIVSVETQWGTVQAKMVTGIDGEPKVVPEYEVCRKIAQEQGIALRRVYDVIARSAPEQIRVPS